MLWYLKYKFLISDFVIMINPTYTSNWRLGLADHAQQQFSGNAAAVYTAVGRGEIEQTLSWKIKAILIMYMRFFLETKGQVQFLELSNRVDITDDAGILTGRRAILCSLNLQKINGTHSSYLYSLHREPGFTKLRKIVRKAPASQKNLLFTSSRSR